MPLNRMVKPPAPAADRAGAPAGPSAWRVVASDSAIGTTATRPPGQSEQSPAAAEKRNLGIPHVIPDLAEMFKEDQIVAVRAARRGRDCHPAGASRQEAARAPQSIDLGRQELAHLVEVWPTLPQSIQGAILAIVGQSAPGQVA